MNECGGECLPFKKRTETETTETLGLVGMVLVLIFSFEAQGVAGT